MFTSSVKVATSIDSDADRMASVPQTMARFSVVVERQAIRVSRGGGGLEVRELASVLPQGSYQLYKKPGEELCGMPVIRGRNIGIAVNVGFTADRKFADSVVSARLVNRQKARERYGGTFVVEGIDGLRTLFTEQRQDSADRLIDKFMFDPDVFLIPRSTCSELGIRDGETIDLKRDPTIRPLGALLR